MTHTLISDLKTFHQLAKGEGLSECECSSLNLSDAPLKSLRIEDCKFSACTLANADLTDTRLRSVQFESCNLIGINWAGAASLVAVTFRTCKLDYGVFQSASLKNCQFIGCSIIDADFSACDLSKAVFTDSRLAGSSFNGANLEMADFRNAKDYFIDARTTKVRGARFNLPDALSLIEALGAEVEV